MPDGATAAPEYARPLRAHLVSVALVAAVALAASLLIGPALLDPSDRVAGERSDPAAEVWHFEQMATGRLGLIEPTTTPMANAPDGARLRRPVEVTTALVSVVAWPFERFMDAASVRNIVLLLGVMTNGLAMLVVASVLRLSRSAALIGAIVFMYAPPLVIEARLHAALVFAAPVPLAFAAGIRLHRRGDLRSGVLLGLVVGLSCYVNPYVPLYAAAIAIAVAVTVLVDRRSAVPALLVSAATAVVAAAPALVLLTARRSDTLASVRRSVAELELYAVTPADMVRALGPWPLGVGVFVVASVFLVLIADAATRRTAALVALAGVVLSLGATTLLMGVSVPMPNRVLFAIYPAWRVVGRASVLVWFVVALALALGASGMRRAASAGPRSFARPPWVAVGAAVVVLAASYDHGRPWFPADETPALSAFLRDRSGTVAEYPLYGLDHHESGPYLLRQVAHGRPLVNGNLPSTANAQVSQVVRRLDDPQAQAGLAIAGARTIVVHGDDPAPTWGHELGTYDGARVFDLDPVADPAIVTWSSAYDEESSGVDRWQWVTGSTVLHVMSTRPAAYRVRMDLLAAGPVRTLRVGAEHVLVGPVERAAEVCIASRAPGPAGLFVGSAELAGNIAAAPISPDDPRRALARVRNAVVVGPCGE